MIAIVSAGPSLARTLELYDPGDYDVSIAVNVGVCRAWTTHYCCLDTRSLLAWPWKNPEPVLVMPKSKVASAATQRPERRAALESLRRVNVADDLMPHHLRQPVTSGPAALIFAVCEARRRGARHIHAYGCDMGGTGHYRPEGVDLPSNYGRNRGELRWHKERRHWARLTRFAAKLGITVERVKA